RRSPARDLRRGAGGVSRSGRASSPVFPGDALGPGGRTGDGGGDLLIDEILSLQVSMVEAVQPVFSFKGYTYSKVMRGQRQISGSFTIAYRETGWLHRVLA